MVVSHHLLHYVLLSLARLWELAIGLQGRFSSSIIWEIYYLWSYHISSLIDNGHRPAHIHYFRTILPRAFCTVSRYSLSGLFLIQSYLDWLCTIVEWKPPFHIHILDPISAIGLSQAFTEILHITEWTLLVACVSTNERSERPDRENYN